MKTKLSDEALTKLKDLGLERLEGLTKEAAETLFDALEIVIKDTNNTMDDMLLPALPYLKGKLLELIDKIHA